MLHKDISTGAKSAPVNNSLNCKREVVQSLQSKFWSRSDRERLWATISTGPEVVKLFHHLKPP